MSRETDRKALAERLRNGLMKHEDGVLVKVKGEAVCTVRDLRALLATALREEGEPVAYMVECPHDDCEVRPSYEEMWPPDDPLYECGLCGSGVDDFIVTPLYRHPHTEDESE